MSRLGNFAFSLVAATTTVLSFSVSTSTVFARSSATIRVLYFTQTANPGREAEIEIQTAPRALATIEVDYHSGRSKAQGLYPKHADSHGDVTWQWMVGTRTYPGDWPVTINSSGHRRVVYLHVVKR